MCIYMCICVYICVYYFGNDHGFGGGIGKGGHWSPERTNRFDPILSALLAVR